MPPHHPDLGWGTLPPPHHPDLGCGTPLPHHPDLDKVVRLNIYVVFNLSGYSVFSRMLATVAKLFVQLEGNE